MTDLPHENVCLNCRADLTVVRCAACCGNPIPSAFATHATEPAPVAVDQERIDLVLKALDHWGHPQDKEAAKLIRDLTAPRADLAPTGNTALVALNELHEYAGREPYTQRLYDKVAAALQPAAPQPSIFGPYGWLIKPEGLKEDNWYLSNGPEADCVSVPLYAEEEQDLGTDAPQPTPEVEALREALHDLTSWFEGGPSEYGPWIIKAGPYGADDAVKAASAALARGSVAEKGER